MELKCPTCGYNVKDSTICPRCRTKLLSCFECSGNCLKCNKIRDLQKNSREEK